MKKRIAPILAILAWLHGGRLTSADELSVTPEMIGPGNMTYRNDKALRWHHPWQARVSSQLDTLWIATDLHWAKEVDRRYSLSQSPAYTYAFSRFRYLSSVEGDATIGLDYHIEPAIAGVKSDNGDLHLSF